MTSNLPFPTCINRLTKAKNKCVKLIEPTIELPEIYKKYKILKLTEMIQLEEIKHCFKQINKLIPVKLQYIVDHDHHGRTLNKKHAYSTRNKRIPNCPPTHNHKYKNSFLSKGIISYSNLSYKLRSANTYKSVVGGFKRAIFD